MDPGGLGPIRYGGVLTELDPAISPVIYVENGCVSPDHPGIVPGGPGSGYWEQHPSTGPFSFSVHTRLGAKDGPVFWILARDHLRSDRGVGIGSSVAELEAAYEQFDEVLESALTRVYAVDGGASRLVFEVVTATDWWPERAGQVAIMRVEPTEWELASIAATDAGAHCPI